MKMLKFVKFEGLEKTVMIQQDGDENNVEQKILEMRIMLSKNCLPWEV